MSLQGGRATWVSAASLDKLQAELDRRLARYGPDDVVGLSHSSATTSSRQSGGIWSGARTTYDIEYSAVALVRIA